MEIDKVSQCLCISLRRASNTLTEYYDTHLAPSGLKLTQFSLLHRIRLKKSISITELAEDTGLDRTTMGKNLQLMARNGLLTLSPGTDRRERVAVLTHQGERALAKAYPLWEAAQTAAVGAVGLDKVRAFKTMLSDLEKQIPILP